MLILGTLKMAWLMVTFWLHIWGEVIQYLSFLLQQGDYSNILLNLGMLIYALLLVIQEKSSYGALIYIGWYKKLKLDVVLPIRERYNVEKVETKGGYWMELYIDKNEKTSIYIQIYEQIKRQIISGELPHGYILPPERKLAVKLGVNRSTILNAYNKLKQEELIDSKVGQGTLVSLRREEWTERMEPVWTQIFSSRLDEINNNMVEKMFPLMEKKEIISFALGMADPERIPQLPFPSLAETVYMNKNLLSQTPVAGSEELRKTICRLLAQKDMVCTMDQIMIVSGSQQGIDMVSRVLIEPGDIVVVEAPTYFLALESFRAAGARIIEIPVDKDGMQIEELEQLVKRYHPKCIFTIPNYQNPSSCSMSMERRKRLLELAYCYDILILEDEAYAEIGYDHNKLPSLFELDQNGYVIQFHTFSKTICSGIRLGYMLAHKNMIAQCCFIRQSMDIHPNNISQWLVNEFIRSGAYENHVNQIRQNYMEKRDIMHNMLLCHAPEGVVWLKPEGGYYVWCRIPQEVRSSELLMLCLNEGVMFMPGIPFFAFQDGEHYMRLNFTTPTKEQIQKGIPIICSNISKLMRKELKDVSTNQNNYLPVY